MNTLLGGSFTSRLNDNLREQHGYSYGAASRLLRYRTGGLFVAFSDVQTDKTAPAVTEFVKELERIRTPAKPRRRSSAPAATRPSATPATSRPRPRWRAGWPTASSTTCRRASSRSSCRRRSPRTARRLAAAARSVVDPARMAFVVVGDRKAVEVPLRALGLGTVRTLTVDDVMGPAPAVE